MNHDITHCRNHLCIKSKKCYRHLAYIEALNINLERFSVIASKPFKKDGCDLYWEIK